MSVRASFGLLLALAACNSSTHVTGAPGGSPAQDSWLDWHAKKRDVDMAVSEAIDPPRNDYAKGVDIIRASDRPAGIEDHEVGLLIIASFDLPEYHRPPESLQQGLELLEKAATEEGESREVSPQQLRLIFERGAGLAPNNIPVDAVIADCWHKLENGGAGDPRHCIDLRRQRLPHVGQ